MSEFKLSCPHCKQHVLADTSWATQAIDCPHCHKAFTVPNMPGATPPPASPQPQSVPATPANAAPAPKRSSPLTIVLIVLALVAAVVAYQMFVATPADGGGDKQASQETRPVSGTIHGSQFHCTSATVNSFMGTLEISQGDESVPEQGVKIFLFPKAGESLAGRTWNIAPNADTSQPHVHLAWKKDGQAASAIVSSDYEMQLTTGEATNGVMTGTFKFKSGGESPATLEGGFTATVK